MNVIPMARRLMRPLGRLCALAPVLVLGACSLAPGMPERLGLPPEGAGQTSGAAASGVTLEPITSELLDRLNRDERSIPPALRALIGEPATLNYRIGAGDVLAITVWNHPDLNAGSVAIAGPVNQNGYPVSQDGMIQFPFIGSLKVQGLTEQAVRDQLGQRLARFFKKPQVTVRIQTYRSSRIYIDGAVGNPGLQVLDDIDMTLAEAVARAGGFSPAADRNAIVLTRGTQNVDIPLARLMAQGVNPASIRLQAGDVLRVQTRDNAKVYVMGEVLRPNALPLRDGQLRLSEALGEVGGLNPASAEPSQVYVLRTPAGAPPVVYHLDASRTVSFALADRFALAPRDVVYVDPSPIVRWNRVISLLLPSASGLSTVRDLRQ